MDAAGVAVRIDGLADYFNDDEQMQPLLGRVQQLLASIDRMHDRVDDTTDRGDDALEIIKCVDAR